MPTTPWTSSATSRTAVPGCWRRSLRSALANAEDRRATNLDQLVVVDVRVDGGPMFKRMQPKARGMASVLNRRMSHIRVALE